MRINTKKTTSRCIAIQKLKTSYKENLKNKENKTHDGKRNGKNDNQPHGGQWKTTAE